MTFMLSWCDQGVVDGVIASLNLPAADEEFETKSIKWRLVSWPCPTDCPRRCEASPSGHPWSDLRTASINDL